jgi:hypothetical protein
VTDRSEGNDTQSEFCGNSAPRSSIGPSMIADGGPTCDGDLIPIREAQALLDDEDWCKQVRYSESLELA